MLRVLVFKTGASRRVARASERHPRHQVWPTLGGGGSEIYLPDRPRLMVKVTGLGGPLSGGGGGVVRAAKAEKSSGRDRVNTGLNRVRPHAYVYVSARLQRRRFPRNRRGRREKDVRHAPWLETVMRPPPYTLHHATVTKWPARLPRRVLAFTLHVSE